MFNFKKVNKIAKFPWDINQGDDVKQHYLCTLFAPAIMVRYNCGIEITEKDINKIARIEIANWDINPKSWGSGKNGFYAIYEYIKNNADLRGWKVPKYKILTNSNVVELNDWLDRGYMATIWIAVNRDFPKDAKDWKLDLYKDYANYKWQDIHHFTNIMRWIDRWNSKGSDYWKEWIVDSYATMDRSRKFMYECDAKEVLEDIAMNTKYIFHT